MINDLNKALDWIYSFTNLEINRNKKKFRNNYKLKKIEYLLDKLGNPHKNQKIIHIAGTKGKGSTAYILNKLAIKSGFKTALYTSPHLFNVNERIRINDIPISDNEFINLVNIIKPIVEKIENPFLIPTFFDIFTAIAFYYFYQNKAQIWIIETGLGGRLDSTNIVTPVLSVITSISREHTKILGTTLNKIANEKGGIIKEKIPVILSKNRTNVINTIKDIAKKNNAPFFYLNNLIKYRFIKYIKEDNQIYQLIKINNDLIKTSLLGLYQIQNIALVKLITQVLNNLQININFNADLLKNIIWLGRLTYKKYQNTYIFFDGAHNRVSAAMLKKSILQMNRDSVLDGEKTVSIVGILKGKDYTGILENIVAFSDLIYFIEPYEWRDSKIENYISTFKKINKTKSIPYIILNDTENLIKTNNFYNYIISTSKKYLKTDIINIIITGSLYTVAKLYQIQ